MALVGAGSMGNVHAGAYATIPDVRVVAVVDRDRAAAEALAEKLAARAYTDLDGAIDAAHPDAIDCCLPTSLHRATVEAAAARGRHVVCEKPLALTADDGRAMIAACRAAGVRLLVAQVVRFFPEYRRLAAEARDGRIGRPVLCTLLRQGFYPSGHEGWYRDEARSGGIFLDLLIHDIDWALRQFGAAERVYARLVRAEGPPPYTQGMATLRHRSGVISGLTGVWGYPGPFTTAVEIAGTEGLLRYHSDEARPLRLLAPAPDVPAGADGVPLPELAAGEDPYRTELAHFVDVLHGRAEPLVRPDESLAALEVALAARASAATGQAWTFDREDHA